MADHTREQVDQNYEAFVALLPTLLKTHAGKFALMRDGKTIEFFDTARDAYVTGTALFKDDNLFSIQEVVEVPVNLGFFSYAMS